MFSYSKQHLNSLLIYLFSYYYAISWPYHSVMSFVTPNAISSTFLLHRWNLKILLLCNYLLRHHTVKNTLVPSSKLCKIPHCLATEQLVSAASSDSGWCINSMSQNSREVHSKSPVSPKWFIISLSPQSTVVHSIHSFSSPSTVVHQFSVLTLWSSV